MDKYFWLIIEIMQKNLLIYEVYKNINNKAWWINIKISRLKIENDE